MSHSILSSMFSADTSWLNGSTSVKITWALIHFSWQGTFVAMCFLLANWGLKRRSANCRYITGVVALTVLAFCPMVTYCLMPVPALLRSEATNSIDPIKSVATATFSEPVSIFERLDEPPEVAEPMPVAQKAVSISASTRNESTTWLMAVSPFVVSLYLVGVALMLARLAVSLWAGQQLRLAATEICDESIQRMVRQLCERWAMSVIPVVAYCQRVTVPVVVGIMRPMILLPPSLVSGLNVEQLEALLIHELAHIRRWDLVVNVAQRIVESLLFMHPAVWYISNRISIERENACDDLVLASGWQPTDYVSALLHMAGICATSPTNDMISPSLLAATGGGPSQLKQRVLRMLGDSSTPSAVRERSTGFGGLISVVFVLMLACFVLTRTSQRNVEISKNVDSNEVPGKTHLQDESIATSNKESRSQKLIDFAEPLADVVIEGNSTISKNEIAKHYKSRPNCPMSLTQIKEDVDALIGTRLFQRVEPSLRQSSDGLVLVFSVVEAHNVQSVEYRGADEIEQKRFERMTRLKPGSRFNADYNQECARLIKEKYHVSGYAFAIVKLEKGNEEDDRDIVFSISKGPRVKIQSVKFEGNNEFVTAILDFMVRSKKRVLGIFGDKYDASSITDGTKAVEQLYHDHGFLDVQVRSQLNVTNEEPKRGFQYAEAQFQINEGRRYIIRNVEFEGNEIIPNEVIQQLIAAKCGDVFLSRKVNLDISKIYNEYIQRGHRSIGVELIKSKIDNEALVDITFTIDEKPKSISPDPAFRSLGVATPTFDAEYRTFVYYPHIYNPDLFYRNSQRDNKLHNTMPVWDIGDVHTRRRKSGVDLHQLDVVMDASASQVESDQSRKTVAENPDSDQINAELEKIEDAKALVIWKTIEYYADKQKPKGVITHCRELIAKYPKSSYTEKARAKLKELNPDPEDASKVAQVSNLDESSVGETGIEVSRNSKAGEMPNAEQVDLTPATPFHLDEPIVEVQVIGNATIPSAEIAKHLKVRSGQTTTQEQIKDDVDALVRTRWFASVEPALCTTDAGSVLVYRVVERPIVRGVEYKGLKKVKQQVLDSLTQLKPGSPFSVTSNRECVRRIEEYYHDKGFTFATVELEKGDNRDDRDVVFLIHEGPKVKATKVEFEGNQQTRKGALMPRTRTTTAVVWIIGGIRDDSTIQTEIDSIKQKYHETGHFDVEITHEEKNDTNSSLVIHYKIDQGVRYTIRDIEIVGNVVMSKEQIMEIMTVTPGDFYDSRKITSDIDTIKSKYGEKGHLFCRVEVVPRFCEEKGCVDLVFKIDEDRVYRISNIAVQRGDLAVPKKIQLLKSRLENTNAAETISKNKNETERQLPAMLFPDETWNSPQSQFNKSEALKAGSGSRGNVSVEYKKHQRSEPTVETTTTEILTIVKPLAPTAPDATTTEKP